MVASESWRCGRDALDGGISQLRAIERELSLMRVRQRTSGEAHADSVNNMSFALAELRAP